MTATAMLAPAEGAFAWHQGFVMMKNATNVDQAHELAKWVSTAEGAAVWATAFSSNPVGKGAADKLMPGSCGLLQRHLQRRSAVEAVVVAGPVGRIPRQARGIRRQVQGGLIAAQSNAPGPKGPGAFLSGQSGSD